MNLLTLMGKYTTFHFARQCTWEREELIAGSTSCRERDPADTKKKDYLPRIDQIEL